jgi:hypothetical protein
VLALSAAAMASGASSGTTSVVAARHVVLGSKRFAPSGYGFGKARPKTFFNGGAPSGLVKRIHWKGWGTRSARGRGLTSIYKPNGGYYKKPGRIKLHAFGIGPCTKHGPRAYRHLRVRIVKRPGGRYGRWFNWSGARHICGP